MDGDSWSNATRALLVATSRAENTGMKWKRTTARGRTGWELKDWGKPPTVIEPVHLDCKLDATNAGISIYALDGRGARMGEIEVDHNGDRASFNLTGDPATLWYEIEWKR